MRRRRISRHRLLFAPEFHRDLAGQAFTLVDVGARGDLEEPWLSMDPSTLRVVGFEPDPVESRRLNEQTRAGRTYLPLALWSRKTTLDLHLAAEASCSSVHPPNFDLLGRYDDAHRRPRATVRKARVAATTLDRALADHRLDCDFLKIDTQGAEHEVLEGAREVLEKQAVGVLVETWTSEVHKNQGLTGDVLSLMARHGWFPFDLGVAAAWTRSAASREKLPGRAQLMGLDLLFLRDVGAWTRRPHGLAKVLKAAAVAEVFGFPDLAVELLDARAKAISAEASALDATRASVIANARRTGGFASRLGRGALGRLGWAASPYPSLHS